MVQWKSKQASEFERHGMGASKPGGWCWVVKEMKSGVTHKLGEKTEDSMGWSKSLRGIRVYITGRKAVFSAWETIHSLKCLT